MGLLIIKKVDLKKSAENQVQLNTVDMLMPDVTISLKPLLSANLRILRRGELAPRMPT